MFAVVRTGGKQYRVTPGDKIVVEKMPGDAGQRIDLGDVLLAGEGSDLKSVEGLKVAAEIIAQAKGDKVTVFKKRRRHNYRRKKGHRQQHTILRIVAIGDHKYVPSKAEGADKPAPSKGKAETKAAKATRADAAPAKAAAPAKPAKADAKPKAAKPKKAEAKPKSTKDAAPAKGGAKKSPKAK